MEKIDRSFEKIPGFITAAQLPEVDWTDKKQIEWLYPEYQRNYLKLLASRKKFSKNVEIESFDLETIFKDAFLFQNAKLYIEPKKRCAVFGINGSGKSSLFNAISSGGIREFPNFIHVHHMKELEHSEEADKVSVLDTVMSSHPFLRVLLAIQEKLNGLIAEDESNADLKSNLEYVKQGIRNCGGETALKRATQMLHVLGFDDTGLKAPLSSLSGGLRMRVALASAFFIDPELLLLDEPTNHLDMPSVLWLENKLRGYKGAYLLVTHDRTLLQNVVTSVMLIQDMKIDYFDCGFDDFERQREKLDVKRENEIERFLQLNRNIDPSSALAKRKKDYQIWQEKRRVRMVMLNGKFTFKKPAPLPTGPYTEKTIPLITVKDVRFSYDEAKGLPFIFDNPISYQVTTGTRVGIMGPNGAGKSTLLKLITGKIFPTSGTIEAHPSYTLAYFGQHSTKELHMEDTPLSFMVKSFPKAREVDLKQHLEKTSIGFGPMNSRMKNLSFSQRSCVIFAKLTFVPPHLLILDEPTNFLDLDSVDSLIKAVNQFQGAVITVTHNRDFLKKCSKAFLSIIPGAFLEFRTMKEAERATYSFISALEEGRTVDAKTAIQENRGGGAVHTDEYMEQSRARLTKQQSAAEKKRAEKAAEDARLAAIAEAKAAKAAAKKAAIKLDWEAGDSCFALVNGTYVPAKVVRNIPSMGITVELESGKTQMMKAKQVKAEMPDASGAAKPAGKAAGRGGAGAGRGGRGAAKAGGPGRGGRGGARGGRGGARGGARGGRGRGGARN